MGGVSEEGCSDVLLENKAKAANQGESKMRSKATTYAFSGALLVFQTILIVLFAVYAQYKEGDRVSDNNAFYPTFQDVHVMIFAGIGFLVTFLRRYSFSAVGYNLMVGAMAAQWGMLCNAWFAVRMKGKSDFTVTVNVQNMLTSDFTAGAVLISWCAILGKTSRLQLVVLAVFEPVFFALNESICFKKLHISDVGGSVVLHIFAAYFGIGMAISMYDKDQVEHPKESSSFMSDLFACVGTVFLWCYWISFNASPLATAPFQQNRAFANTYLSLMAATVTVFMVSPLVEKNGRVSMVHVQNATLAGGVGVGAVADLMIPPWSAMLIGVVCGAISVLGFTYMTPFLAARFKIHDTAGVNNLHGMPGIISGIAAAIAAAYVPDTKYEGQGGLAMYGMRSLNATEVAAGADWSAKKQGAMQLGAIGVTIVISLVGGLIAGLAARWVDPIGKDDYYDDDRFWEVPEPAIDAMNEEVIPNVARKLTNNMEENTAC